MKKPISEGLIFLGGFLLAFFFTQGLPLWDDDYTSWLNKFQNTPLQDLLFALINPFTQQPESWGFNERPLEALFYRFCYEMSGYSSWIYFFIKDGFYAATGLMIYLWSKRVSQPIKLKHSVREWICIGVTSCFLLSSGPIASLIILADFAPVAEFLFLFLTYFIWQELERKEDFRIKRWVCLVIATYLSYRTKADLKLIPIISGIYLIYLWFSLRCHHLRSKIAMLGCMGLLAVPWSPSIFSQLPPFIPGSKGSPISWMWQPASLEALKDFIWDRHWIHIPFAPALSIASIAGPFLLILFLGAVGIYILTGFINRQWKFRLNTQHSSQHSSVIYILIWMGVILIGVSALAPINYFFRIRYGILTLVPFSILLAWSLSWMASHFRYSSIIIGLLLAQTALNGTRSVLYRRHLGTVIVSVHSLYTYINEKLPQAELILMPDFLAYDFRPDSSPSIKNRRRLTRKEDLTLKSTPQMLLTWSPIEETGFHPFKKRLKMIQKFSGCTEASTFDRIFDCTYEANAHLIVLD